MSNNSYEVSNDFQLSYCIKSRLPMLLINTSLDYVTGEETTTNSFQKYCRLSEPRTVTSGHVGHHRERGVSQNSSGTPYFILAIEGTSSNEAGGASMLCGALIKMVMPSNGHLTLEDVEWNSTLT
ncbi:hypothetical protein SI65_03536 [Aspergillus cristatus]|uniref:Uncharacterized protein n=1 Tax=Aspergillus cristatus TaxID=573508 RepID=A0A1E3BHP0_ASPCR|nr:hypothetical protein SI65_03536 [Aspergillus cristatus]